MATKDPVDVATFEDEGSDLSKLFEGLTLKQHEVFALVSENRTSKEVAAQLGITESAVNQRIEAVRLRAGGLPRPQLARAYRQFRSQRPDDWVREVIAPAEVIEAAPAPSRGKARALRVEPDLSRFIQGGDVRLHRVAAVVVIAAGLMVTAAGGLAVAHVLTLVL